MIGTALSGGPANGDFFQEWPPSLLARYSSADCVTPMIWGCQVTAGRLMTSSGLPLAITDAIPCDAPCGRKLTCTQLFPASSLRSSASTGELSRSHEPRLTAAKIVWLLGCAAKSQTP